ncbi:hypothetical protein pdam_00002590 [Pocillopora damicornis]|uniref:Uncharacterized protein n=1 Tax=Pocillopora damicornis TaxID=46731 RepID=A0A3M6U3C5_POCDA|nr:hypothetical protein pdam_00002590 [Pocillopora damicornis]
MAYLSKVLSLNQERVNSMESKTLKTRTKVNTVRGRPAVRELYERSIYERTHDYELYRVFRRDREPSRIPVRTLKCLRNKSRKMMEFVYKRILPSIPKSSKLQFYTHVKVRKFSKIEKHKCKRGTKIINLNKIIQHETVLLNCSRRVYQRIIKWKYKARQYLLLFPCRRVMCLYKTETNISNYCKIKLTTDIEKNPGLTSLYIDTRYFTECVL